MLDAAFIRANLEAVKSNCKNRNLVADVDKVVAIDDERKNYSQPYKPSNKNKMSCLNSFPKKKTLPLNNNLLAKAKLFVNKSM